MQKFSLQIKIFITTIIIAMIVNVIFLSLIYVNWTLVVGWTMGTLTILIGQLITLFFVKYIFKNWTNKVIAIFFYYVKIVITLIFHSLIFIGIITINKYVSGVNFWDKGIEYIYAPINVFTYIGGICLIPISTFVTHMFIIRKEKNEWSK